MANDDRRQLSDIPYVSAGAVSSLDLPRDSVLKEMSLMWTLSQTSGAAAAVGTLADPGIFAAVRRLELVADGALTLWSLDPFSLYILDAFWNGAFPQRDTLVAPAATLSNILQGYLEMPFALPFSANPNLTLLNAAALTSLQLKVSWGGVADLYQTPNNTAINTTSILAPEVHEVVGLGPRSIFSLHKISQITSDVTAAAVEKEIDLPRSNIIRALLFKTKILTNTIEDEVDTILNEIRIESNEMNRGAFTHRKIRCTDTDGTARQGYHVRNNARVLYGLADLNLQAAAAAVPPLTGFYPVEFMEDRRISSAIRTQAFTSFKAKVNVSAPAGSPQIITTVQEVVPAARPR